MGPRRHAGLDAGTHRRRHARRRESAVTLAEPIPVSIGYFTVWVDSDGAVQFRPDVYRHDAAQAPLLEGLDAPANAPAATLDAAG